MDKAFNRHIQLHTIIQIQLCYGILGRKHQVRCNQKGIEQWYVLKPARLEKLLQFGESISAEISALPADI